MSSLPGWPSAGASLTESQVRSLRLRAQRLVEPRATSVADAVHALGGVQAQVVAAARLAIRARTRGLHAETVTAAGSQERSVVRTWAMRGTLHMVPAEDARWLVDLLGPIFDAASRGRRRQLGLTEDVCDRGLRAMRDILGGHAPLTRGELVEHLARMGVALNPRSQAPYHLVRHAALLGVICLGPDRADDEPTYVLLDDWVGARPAVDRSTALAELARRYVGAHGPGTIEDLATWAGIATGAARRALELIASEIVEVGMPGGPAWMLANGPSAEAAREEPSVRLLPHFDPYLLGYRQRDLLISPLHARRIQAGGGWIHPVLVVDGRVAGSWRQHRLHDGMAVEVRPFEPISPEVIAGVDAEVTDIGRFLSTSTTLSLSPVA